MRRRPSRLAVTVATWFGVGLLPAPGTWGSAAAMPLAYAVALAGGPPALLLTSAVLFAVGYWAAESYVQATAEKDPKEIVIDEVASQMLPLAVVPLAPLPWLAAFLIFRVFDIFKPWPCDYLERRLPRGLGVMADDCAAGLYAALCVLALGAVGAW